MKNKSRLCAVCLILTLGIIWLTAGCSAGVIGEVPAEKPPMSPAESQAEPAVTVSACEYEISGGDSGGYTYLAANTGEKTAELSFRYAAAASGPETAAETPIDPELMGRLYDAVAEYGMADWGEMPPGELTEETDAVTYLHVTLSNGLVIEASTACRLPDGGDEVLNYMAEIMYSALTPDGKKVFGDASSPVDLAALAEPEPDVIGLEEELDIHHDMYVAEQLDIIRHLARDTGNLYAIALLGRPDTSGGSLASDRGYLSLLLEAEGYQPLSFLSRLPESCLIEAEGGTDLYLLMTAWEQSSVQISRWVSNGEGGQTGELLFDGDGSMPLLLCCNGSEEGALVQITITDAEGNSVSFCPHLAAEGGWESGTDFSNYTLAVG